MGTDSTTAVEGARRITIADELESAPLKAFRRKRRRVFPEQVLLNGGEGGQRQRYWSEYDHPEDGSEAGGEAYVLFVDPDEKGTFELILERLGAMFRRPERGFEHDPLLPHSPLEEGDEEEDSDEEAAVGSHPHRINSKTRSQGYATFPSTHHARHTPTTQHNQPLHLTVLSLIASLTLLLVAFALTWTGRHKLQSEVHSAVFFAVAACLLFACCGLAALWRQREGRGLWVWAAALGVVGVDVVGCGFLAARILGGWGG